MHFSNILEYHILELLWFLFYIRSVFWRYKLLFLKRFHREELENLEMFFLNSHLSCTHSMECWSKYSLSLEWWNRQLTRDINASVSYSPSKYPLHQTSHRYYYEIKHVFEYVFKYTRYIHDSNIVGTVCARLMATGDRVWTFIIETCRSIFGDTSL